MEEFKYHFTIEVLLRCLAYLVAFRLQVELTKHGDATHTVADGEVACRHLVVADEERVDPEGGSQGVL